MNRFFACALTAALAATLAPAAVPARAAEARPSNEPATTTLQNAPLQTEAATAESVAAAEGVVFAPSRTSNCIDNPRFNPDNDANGPRSTELWSDATPYVSTPTANLAANCR